MGKIKDITEKYRRRKSAVKTNADPVTIASYRRAILTSLEETGTAVRRTTNDIRSVIKRDRKPDPC